MLLVAHRTPPTREGCLELRAAGARVFELDVQLAGSSVVVSHYLPVLRVRGWLENDNWKVRWGGRGPSRDPELQALVDLVPDDCAVLLDPKERTAGRRAELADRVIAHGFDTSRFCVSTHDDGDLRRYREAGFRTWRTAGTRRELAVLLAGGPRSDEAVSVRHTLLTEATIERLHSLVPTVVAWTVNTAGTAGRLRAMGVDGLTTDRREVMTYAAT